MFTALPILALAGPQLARAAETQADFLFVQSARRMTFDKATKRLTLQGVSEATIFFSDRPDRIAGNMKTTAFVPFWSKGKDSFLSNPPNADISTLEGDRLRQFVVVLRDPILQGENLTHTIRVVKGDIPTSAADVSVFIDIIGMPLTPVSYAGVARRSYRRAVLYLY